MVDELSKSGCVPGSFHLHPSITILSDKLSNLNIRNRYNQTRTNFGLRGDSPTVERSIAEDQPNQYRICLRSEETLLYRKNEGIHQQCGKDGEMAFEERRNDSLVGSLAKA